MTRYQIHRGPHAVPGDPQPAGLVLGHSVLVATASGPAHRGTVSALDPDVEVRLDRAAWSDAFRVGDRVRAAQDGRRPVEAMVVASAHGMLWLRLLPERNTCARCDRVLSVWSMSRFNTDALCMRCVDDEQQAPGYAEAAAAEAAHVRAGNLHFPGVGLSPADAAFLAERRAAR